MKIKILFFLSILCSISMSAQVGIGTISPEAGVDMATTTNGLLIPRVALTNLNVEAPVLNPQGGSIPESTLIYHDGSNAITAGFYYWDGTQWVLLTTGESNDWTVLGNAGTNPTTNFVGTTDTQDFVIRTDNTERARVTSGGDVGIGIAVPTAKTHIIQTAAVDGVVSNHSGTAGNALEILTTGTTNASSALWIRNNTSGTGINNQMNNTTTTTPGMSVGHAGLGSGIEIYNTNAGNTPQSLYIDQDGTGGFSRGIDTYMDAANAAIGHSLFHNGTGAGEYIGLTNAASGATGSTIYHDGIGTGEYIELTNTASNASNSFLVNEGLGRGLQIQLNNTANNNIGLGVWHAGNGDGQYVTLNSATNTGTASYVHNQGLGPAQYVWSNNTASNTSYSAMTVIYEGIGTGGTGGGGNALEIQHNGTNSNALEIFIGDPQAASGPANTTSEFSTISATHMATGASGATNTKSTFIGNNNSQDPTIVASNDGNEAGYGIIGYVTPSTNDPVGIYGQSFAAGASGYGTGVLGYGQLYGVRGIQGGGVGVSFAVYGSGDYGGTGAKYFTIDHPLDPENKILNHYSIESNEVTNMYRGIVTLDTNGKAIVNLPDYFSAVNIEPSYQLTPIGTNAQPYIVKEVTNNQFTVGGAPNTKISWTVYAKRNDPTIKYFDQAGGKNYDQEVVEKPAHMKGKYFTPEAYGKDKTQSIHYNAYQESYNQKIKNIKSQKGKPIKPKAEKASTDKFKPAKALEKNIIKEESEDNSTQTKK